MSSLPSTIAPGRRLPLKRVAATACVAALAAGASVAVVSALDERATTASPAPAAKPTASRVTTGFGALSVDYVLRLIGSDKPMGLNPPAGTVPIQVGVTVINTSDEPVKLSGRMFTTAPVAAEAQFEPGSLVDRTVPALSAHRILLRYSVRDGVALPQLRFNDPVTAKSLPIELGKGTDGLKTLNVGNHDFGGQGH
jgi:hypothetical protein